METECGIMGRTRDPDGTYKTALGTVFEAIPGDKKTLDQITCKLCRGWIRYRK